jgi:hypothetical protein
MLADIAIQCSQAFCLNADYNGICHFAKRESIHCAFYSVVIAVFGFAHWLSLYVTASRIDI